MKRCGKCGREEGGLAIYCGRCGERLPRAPLMMNAASLNASLEEAQRMVRLFGEWGLCAPEGHRFQTEEHRSHFCVQCGKKLLNNESPQDHAARR